MNINVSQNNLQVFKKLDAADGKVDKVVTKEGLQKALKSDPSLLDSLSKADKSKLQSFLKDDSAKSLTLNVDNQVKAKYDSHKTEANVVSFNPLANAAKFIQKPESNDKKVKFPDKNPKPGDESTVKSKTSRGGGKQEGEFTVSGKTKKVSVKVETKGEKVKDKDTKETKTVFSGKVTGNVKGPNGTSAKVESDQKGNVVVTGGVDKKEGGVSVSVGKDGNPSVKGHVGNSKGIHVGATANSKGDVEGKVQVGKSKGNHVSVTVKKKKDSKKPAFVATAHVSGNKVSYEKDDKKDVLTVRNGKNKLTYEQDTSTNTRKVSYDRRITKNTEVGIYGKSGQVTDPSISSQRGFEVGAQVTHRRK